MRIDFLNHAGDVVGYAEKDEAGNVTCDHAGRQMLNAIPPGPDDAGRFDMYAAGWSKSTNIQARVAA